MRNWTSNFKTDMSVWVGNNATATQKCVPSKGEGRGRGWREMEVEISALHHIHERWKKKLIALEKMREV